MSEPLRGGCLCGAIRFEVSGSLVVKRACWCRTCQYLSCGNASISLIVALEHLRIEGDEPGAHVVMADSGHQIRFRFCSKCGTQLFAEPLAQPGYLVIRAGALDDRSAAGPESTIWTGSAPCWAVWDPRLPTAAGQIEALPE